GNSASSGRSSGPRRTARPATDAAAHFVVVMRVAFATYAKLPELDESDRVALDAVRALGIDARPAVWNDDRGGGALDAVVIRSCWDYFDRPAQFLEWLARLEAKGGVTIVNPPGLLRWNMHKRYLAELARRGVPTVPTVWIDRGSDASVGDIVRENE